MCAMTGATGLDQLMERLITSFERSPQADHEWQYLDARTRTLAEIGAAVCAGASEPTHARLVDAALTAGASADDVLATLLCIADIAGGPRIVTAAPGIAKALHYDIEGALERD